MPSLPERRAAAERELAAIAAEESLTPAQRIATEIHRRTCKKGHSDSEGCNWRFYGWDDIRSDRRSYLFKAEEMIRTAKGNTDLVQAIITQL